MKIDISKLSQDDDFFAEIGSNIWLMDNHKWALYVWEKFRLESSIRKFSLVHADYHWDGVYDMYEKPLKESQFLAANLDELKELIRIEDCIQFDSFIAPAVVKGMFDSIHLFCKQDDTDIGIYDDIRAPTNTRQFVYDDANFLASQKFDYPLIFDLCLDLFNNSDMYATGDIWPDEEILTFLNLIHSLIQNASLITISLSFNYSGTEEDTRHLANLILPKILELREVS